MLILIFVGCLLFLMMVGIPAAFAMAVTSLISGFYLWGVEGIPINILVQQTVSGASNFTTLAIPLFLLAGKLMNDGNITERIFAFCQACVGNMRGGLAQVNVLCSVIFAGMSGTAASDAAGMGAMEIKAMTDAGFDKPFATAITGASSLIGPIIPPSTPLVMYGVLASTSVSALFIGGILPGIIMAISMMVMCHIYSVKRNYPKGEQFSFRLLWFTFRKAFLSLLTVIIIVGGIWSGIFTATEAAGVAVLYAIILSVLVYRNITLKQLVALFREAVVDCGSILFILACVSMYGYVLTRTRIPLYLAEGVTQFTTDPLLVNIMICGFLLVAGFFMSTLESVILFTPVFLPLINEVGINTMSFGIIMVLVLMIGQLTPPFGTVLFILCKISGLGMDTVVKNAVPFAIPVLITVLLCLLFPQIVTILPSLTM